MAMRVITPRGGLKLMVLLAVTACGGTTICPPSPAPALPISAHETWRCHGEGHDVVVVGTPRPESVTSSGLPLDCYLVPLGRTSP